MINIIIKLFLKYNFLFKSYFNFKNKKTLKIKKKLHLLLLKNSIRYFLREPFLEAQ